jgi:hypothetical protein
VDSDFTLPGQREQLEAVTRRPGADLSGNVSGTVRAITVTVGAGTHLACSCEECRGGGVRGVGAEPGGQGAQPVVGASAVYVGVYVEEVVPGSAGLFEVAGRQLDLGQFGEAEGTGPAFVGGATPE